jgi:L-alanine-DL-glutamate epimerase-like enolase superfamily enzyme
MKAKARVFQLSIQRLRLHLRHTFRISRSWEDVAETVVVKLAFNGFEALGESAPISRYDESVELVARQLESLCLDAIDPWHIDAALAALDTRARGARCALDLALYDLAGKRLGIPLYQFLGLDPASAKPTSFTIGIADLETTISKTKEARDFPILKVKLGAGAEIERLEAIRSVHSGTIRIDANEAWTPQEAVPILQSLHRFDIEFCEQPIAAGNPAGLRYVRERSPIPIFVDEDSCVPEDLPHLFGCIDGINIKLVKCGGIREALRMIDAARAMKMKVMIGCMIESSILATAGAHLTPLCDYADLDGPLLVSDDPFAGVRFEGAQLRLPCAPGLGVSPRRAT